MEEMEEEKYSSNSMHCCGEGERITLFLLIRLYLQYQKDYLSNPMLLEMGRIFLKKKIIWALGEE